MWKNIWFYQLKKLVEQEIHPEEIISRLKDSVDHSRGFLIPEDLDHLAKGGRLTPMAANLQEC